MSLEGLPKDILSILRQHLDPVDYVSLGMASKTLYIKILPKLFDECTKEIEDDWNYNASIAAHDATWENGDRHRHPHCSNAFYSRRSWTCECSVFPWKSHNLMVEYNYCPRDVDILGWFLDGQKIGYVML